MLNYSRNESVNRMWYGNINGHWKKPKSFWKVRICSKPFNISRYLIYAESHAFVEDFKWSLITTKSGHWNVQVTSWLQITFVSDPMCSVASNKVLSKSFKGAYIDWIHDTSVGNIQIRHRAQHSNAYGACCGGLGPDLYQVRTNAQDLSPLLRGFSKHPNSPS